MTVVVLEDAAADLAAARRFYDSRHAGVGGYFLESLLADLESLAAMSWCRREPARVPR